VIVVISGPSGISKSYLCWEILDDFRNFYSPRKHTTRKRRPGEGDREYVFVTEQEFDQMRREEKFDTYTRIYNNWYGVSKSELADAESGKSNAIFILDVFIAQEFRKKHSNVVLVYIMPLDRGKLVGYLLDRGTAYEEDVDARLTLLDNELEQWKYFDYVIPFFNSEITYELLRSLIVSETFRSGRYDPEAEPSIFFQFRNFPRLAVDLVILSRTMKKIALIERWKEPRGWALPGGFVKYGEDIESAVLRETQEETGLRPAEISFLDIFSDPNRDPRMHVVSVAYWAKSFIEGEAGGDARNLKWFTWDRLPVNIVFDHLKIIEKARHQLGIKD